MLVKIRLNSIEYEYLSHSKIVPNEFRVKLEGAQEKNGHYILEISDDLACDMDELCAERLGYSGYDEDGWPLPESVILESLRDVFFVE